MCSVSFKERVKNEAIVNASLYQSNFIDYEYLVRLFEHKLLAENNFKKNKVECAFATSDNSCTLGFAVSGRPKSLLKGNELETSKAKPFDLIFRKRRSSVGTYDELVYGNKADVAKYIVKIKDCISKDFIE